MTRRLGTFLTFFLTVHLILGCGTEVGNGFKPDETRRPSESGKGNSGGPGDTAAPTATPESAMPPWWDFVFASCASPFSEKVASSYDASDLKLTVTQSSAMTVTLTFPAGGQTRQGSIAPATTTTADAFDITLIDAKNLLSTTLTTPTCGTITSNTTPATDGTFIVTRQVAVTFAGSNASVTWTLRGATPGTVREITVTLGGVKHVLTASP